ncbi:TPA: transposase [bacterium]|nr:transposase [bacterium]
MNNNQENKQVIRRNRRLYINEGTYFITGVTAQRNPIFQDQESLELLKQILRNVKQLYPFTMQAYAFLPDHFHIIIKPDSDISISKIMQSFKQNFAWDYKKIKGIPNSTSIVVWQSGSWDHVIRNEDDYGKHLDYIHYNPVKHAYVTKPEDFLHTSYIEYIKKGWYEIGWGHREPDNLIDMCFE